LPAALVMLSCILFPLKAVKCFRFFADLTVKEHGHFTFRVVYLYILWIGDHEALKVRIINHFYAGIGNFAAFALLIANIQYNVRLIVFRESITLKAYTFGSGKLGSDAVLSSSTFI
jgi:hypothetical protein